MFLLCAPFVTTKAAEEELDAEFLEWLGQTADAEKVGVDLDTLLKAWEKQKVQSDEEAN